MKHLIVWVILAICAWPQAAVVASRRHNELNPLQYRFGPWTPVAPFNHGSAYTDVSDSQINPSAMVTDNNTFASTSDFTIIQQTSPVTTFSVSGNVGTFTTGTSGLPYVVASSASSFTAPYAFIQVKVVQTASSQGEIFLGISNSTATQRVMVGFHTSTSCYGWSYNGSYSNFFINTSCSMPTGSWYLGMSMVGNNVCMWVKATTTWENIGCGDSGYDLTASGNLSGFRTAIHLGNSSDTWELAALETGGFGGTGLRDISLVTYPDGRPYYANGYLYFTATVTSPSNGGSFDGLFQYQPGTSLINLIGAIFDSRSSHVYDDLASHLIYDPIVGSYWYFVGEWADGNGSTTALAKVNSSSYNILGGGLFILPVAATSITGWDTHVACTALNYSTDACSSWIAESEGGMWTSTTDPVNNVWTSISSQLSSTWEGQRILRTATTSGSSGVAYYPSASTRQASPNNGYRVSASQNAAGTSILGDFLTTLPAGGGYVSHAQIFSFGNTEYFIGFNNTLYGASSYTADHSDGQVFISSAPKYASQSLWPILVNSGTTFSGSTSVSSVAVSTGDYASSFSVAVGDLLVGSCRGGNNSETSVTVTDSLGNTIVNTAVNINSLGFTDGFYTFATIAGTDIFTCTLGSSSQYTGITVEQVRPNGYVTTTDFIGTSNQSTTSNLYTTVPFSTTAKGMVFVCPDGLFGGVPFAPGMIGGYGASFGAGFDSGAAPCMGTITTSAQSNITADMGSDGGASGKWGGVIMSFK